MHHSRLCTVVIDCQTDDLKDAATFWSRALNKRIAKDAVSFALEDADGFAKAAAAVKA